MVPTAHNTAPGDLATQEAVPRRSSCLYVLTQLGKVYAEDRAATHACLATLHEKWVAVVGGALPKGAQSLSEGVTDESVDSFKMIEPNNALPEAATGVVIEEQAHITIRSNRHHNPTLPDYDMTIPPATYEEAIQQPNTEEWLKAM